MRHRRLGRTALRISELGLGTMNFGARVDADASFSILNQALESGIDFVDTADQYGGSAGLGATEVIIGDWLAQDPSRRDRVVLATKVHEPMSDLPNDRGLSARHIRRACDASLRRLRTDHIDLYQMHHIDRAAHWEEIWQAMETLIAQGKITYVGSSNFAGWHLAQANETARARSALGIVSEQSLYHLAQRSVELEVIPACEAYGIAILPWSPLAGGLLAGAGGDDGRRSDASSREERSQRLAHLERWESFCVELGAPPAVVALAWLLHQPAVTAPIVGPRTATQLNDAIAATELRLDADSLAALDEIFPGPGPAPEAYAW